MRWDWYQATIEDRPDVVLGTVAKLGHEVRPNDGIARIKHFHQGFEIHHHQQGVVASVVFGGNGGKPHAWATSDHADRFADLVRQEWPERHLVTRMDACEDFIDATAYDRLRKAARRVAKAHRLRFPQHCDELSDTAGRTQYIGAPSSEYRGRLYEKGWEVVGKLCDQLNRSKGRAWQTVIRPEQFDRLTGVPGREQDEEIRPEEWVRLELQARPKQEAARRRAAEATPEQAWTFTDWSQELAREALALDLERFYVRTRKQSKDDAALRWMCQQYAGALSRLCEDLGNWDMVGRELGRIIEDTAE